MVGYCNCEALQIPLLDMICLKSSFQNVGSYQLSPLIKVTTVWRFSFFFSRCNIMKLASATVQLVPWTLQQKDMKSMVLPSSSSPESHQTYNWSPLNHAVWMTFSLIHSQISLITLVWHLPGLLWGRGRCVHACEINLYQYQPGWYIWNCLF